MQNSLFDTYTQEPEFLPEAHSIPIEFINGSFDSLIRISSIVLFTELGLFDIHTSYPVTFISNTDTCIGGFDFESFRWSHLDSYEINRCSPRLLKLMDLVFDYNTFTGLAWEYNDGSYTHKSGYDPIGQAITFDVHKPSAHEVQEAFIALESWLQDKVPFNEISSLLGL